MDFQIPADLTQLTTTAIRKSIATAQAEYAALKNLAQPDTVTDEQLSDMMALLQFTVTDAPAELRKREERAAAFNSLPDEAEAPAEEKAEAEVEAEEPEPQAVTASTKAPKVKDLVKDQSKEVEVPDYDPPRYSTLVAAAGVPNFEAGHEFTSLLDVAKAFEARSAGHSRITANSVSGPVHYPVAQLVRDYPPEFSLMGDEQTDQEKLLAAGDEKRLPGGSLLQSIDLRRRQIEKEQPGNADALVAAAGWCAPSETDYSICLQITTDGLYDAPEVQARRGGIRHNTGMEFDSIFGAGTGFFNMTEAQVAAGTSKTCLEIPCPSFTDDRLGVTGLCLTGNILSIRGYPEATATFVRGALAASAHQINREQISAVVAGSTAVNLSAAAPWATDGSTVSQVLSAVELAIVDIKYRLRMQRSATLEVIMPYWILAQMRADWIRRNGGNYAEMLCLADSAINSAFSCRSARVQYVYDWQDAFSNVPGTGTGADTPINAFNNSLQFIVYPAGTWVRAVNDVITLNSVYDSTKLGTNQVTHLFTETGWAMLRMCPVSRVYTVPVCPSGKTTSQGTLTCP
jgi:hypothetical protein